MCVCVCVYIYIYIYTHTHAHTCTHKPNCPEGGMEFVYAAQLHSVVCYLWFVIYVQTLYEPSYMVVFKNVVVVINRVDVLCFL